MATGAAGVAGGAVPGAPSTGPPRMLAPPPRARVLGRTAGPTAAACASSACRARPRPPLAPTPAAPPPPPPPPPQYDTVHGRFKGTVTHTADAVVINGKAIKVFNKMNVSPSRGGHDWLAPVWAGGCQCTGQGRQGVQQDASVGAGSMECCAQGGVRWGSGRDGRPGVLGRRRRAPARARAPRLHRPPRPLPPPLPPARQPEEIPWGECGADFVCESTGGRRARWPPRRRLAAQPRLPGARRSSPRGPAPPRARSRRGLRCPAPSHPIASPPTAAPPPPRPARRVHRGGQGAGAHQGRRQEGHHLRPLQGRPHVRHGAPPPLGRGRVAWSARQPGADRRRWPRGAACARPGRRGAPGAGPARRPLRTRPPLPAHLPHRA